MMANIHKTNLDQAQESLTKIPPSPESIAANHTSVTVILIFGILILAVCTAVISG